MPFCCFFPDPVEVSNGEPSVFWVSIKLSGVIGYMSDPRGANEVLDGVVEGIPVCVVDMISCGDLSVVVLPDIPVEISKAFQDFS
jgi:hypothetical protein